MFKFEDEKNFEEVKFCYLQSHVVTRECMLLHDQNRIFFKIENEKEIKEYWSYSL